MLGGGEDGPGRGDGAHGSDRLLDETRRLLAEARAMVDGSLGPAPAAVGPATTILGLYDELRVRLDAVDDRRLEALLQRIARNVERLGELGREVERVRRLRDAIGRL